MTVWSPAPVAEEPEAILTDWAAFEVTRPGSPEPAVHLAGYVGRDGGRTTSAVQEVDAATWRVRTRSGRVYVLRGPPGLNSDAMYTWNCWLHIQNAEVLRDVTNELRAQLGARPAPDRRIPKNRRARW